MCKRKIFKREVERKIRVKERKRKRERKRQGGREMMTMKYVYLCIYVLFIDK